MHARMLWLLLFGFLLVLGCSPSGDRGAGDGEVEQKVQLPELEGEVTAEIATWEEIQQAIADRKGQVVVVDFWSTWCEPCIEEFPHLVTLQRMHMDDVAAMSVNMNYAGLPDEDLEEIKQEALTFLEKQGAKFTNFVSSTPDEELYPQIETVGVPVVLVFDRQGELAKRFDVDTLKRDFTYEGDIYPFVEELLSKK